jgi:hypothetical protein
MKTQINPIINGSAVKIGTISKVGGTNMAKSASIAEQVKAENGETLNILIDGVPTTLTLSYSTTGKSWSYGGEMPLDVYRKHLGGFALPKVNPSARIIIGMNGRVNVSTNGSYIGLIEVQNDLIQIL